MDAANYRNISDVMIQGTYISPITIEDLVGISKIIENDRFIKCIVDKERFVDLYFKRYQGNDGSRTEAEKFYKYFQDDGYAIVRNVYFNVEAKRFENQFLKIVFE